MTHLPPAPLTSQDLDIWVSVGYRFPELPHYTPGWLRIIAGSADHRDAVLMLSCTDFRLDGAYANVRMLQTMTGQDG